MHDESNPGYVYQYFGHERHDQHGLPCMIVSFVKRLSSWVVVRFEDGTEVQCQRSLVRRAKVKR